MSELEVILHFLRDERATLVQRTVSSVLDPTDYAKCVGRINQIDRTAERVIALASEGETDGEELPAQAPSKPRRPVISTKPRSWP